MPNRVLPIIYNNSEERQEYCSMETSMRCLQEYCQENEIDIDRLPSYNIDLFLETCRFAPSLIETVRIATDCGITATNYLPQVEEEVEGYDLYNASVFGTGVGLNQNMRDYNPFLNEYRANQLQADVSGLSSSTSQPMHVSQRVQDMIADLYVPSRADSSTLERNNTQYMAVPVESLGYMPSSAMAKIKVRKRSEHDMFMEIIRGENFPRPMFTEWSNDNERSNTINDWYRSVEYREQWIFSRREREGFNRRNIGFFSLDDVMARISKRRNKHSMDTENSTFYDWKLGGTDWILRLELYHHEGRYFLITHHMFKPADIEVKYDVRYWNGNVFKHVGSIFNDQYNDVSFERVFGTNDINSSNIWHDDGYEEDSCDDEDYEPDYEDS